VAEKREAYGILVANLKEMRGGSKPGVDRRTILKCDTTTGQEGVCENDTGVLDSIKCGEFLY
jgi:hypothetical protein